QPGTGAPSTTSDVQKVGPPRDVGPLALACPRGPEAPPDGAAATSRGSAAERSVGHRIDPARDELACQLLDLRVTTFDRERGPDPGLAFWQDRGQAAPGGPM